LAIDKNRSLSLKCLIIVRPFTVQADVVGETEANQLQLLLLQVITNP